MPIPKDKIETNKIIFFTFLFIVLLLLAFYDIFFNYRTLTSQAMLPKGSSGFVLEIKPHTSARTFVNQLHALKITRSTHVLLALIRWRGLTNHLQAGVYQVNPNETVLQLLDRVVKGDVLVESFRIQEGSTLFELEKNLKLAPYMVSSPGIFAQIAGQHASAEGLFMADTYYYRAGSSAITLLLKANKNLQNYLETLWVDRNPVVPYKNAYELLIAASIIEKEASLPVERKIISGIIVNRLKLRMPLQMDPTVIYAVANEKRLMHPSTESNVTLLTREDLKIKSPYNTYNHYGLPPTPIAMVGRESLEAAAHPEETKYLYFYAKGDGSHQFSKTYKEQQQAIHQFKSRE